MRKILSVILILVIVLTGCSNFTTIGNKVYQGCYGNITPCINSTFSIGNPTHYFENAYIEHLFTANGTIGTSNVTTTGGGVNFVAKFTSPTNLNNSSIQDDGTRVTLSTNMSASGHYFNNLLDPSQLQDAATKNYVDTHATGNVTSPAIVNIGRMPYYVGPRILNETVVFWDNANNRMGIVNDVPLHTLDVGGDIFSTGDITSDSDINAGNDVNVTNDLEVTDDVDIGGTTTFRDQIVLTGSGLIYQQKTMPIQIARIIASGTPTRVERGIFQGFSLPVGGANEELFTCQCISGNWDEGSDMYLYVGGWLDTANTGKKFQLRASYNSWSSGDVVPATSTDVDVETSTGAASQYQAFKIRFTIPAGAMARGDALGIRLSRIAASSDEITGEFVVEGMVLVYRCDSLGSSTY